MNTALTRRLSRIEGILLNALPPAGTGSWQNESFESLDPAITNDHFKYLLTPCRELLLLGGKRWRPLLLVLCAEMVTEAHGEDVSGSVENAYRLTPLVEFAHTASLIHDDIEDASEVRRGKPAAHITWGIDVALNAASWLYFEAAVCIQQADGSVELKNALYNLYLKELRRLHLGQAMDISWHRDHTLIPSIDAYLAMVKNKTGTLARLAVETGILAGGGTGTEIDQAGKIAEDIGVGFQILDDVTNLTTGNPGKKRGDDIVEGKKSLPVLLHLQNHPEDKKGLESLFSYARRDGIESRAVEQTITILTGSGAIGEALQRGTALIETKSRELAAMYKTEQSGQLIVSLFENIQGGKKGA
jgi:octaprenyl-diphosphate synthase